MPHRDNRTASKWRWTLLSASAVLVVSGVLAWREYGTFARATELVDHTYQVLDTIDRTVIRLTEAESALRAFILTSDTSYLDSYDGVDEDVDVLLVRLATLVADNPEQAALAEELSMLARSRLARMAETRSAAGPAPAAIPVAPLDAGRVVMAQMRDVAARMGAAERELLTARAAAADSARRAALTFAIGSLLLAMAISGVAVSVQRSFERRRDAHEREFHARREAERSAAEATRERQHGEALAREVLDSTNDYVTVLDATGHVRSVNRVGREVERVAADIDLVNTSWSARWTSAADLAAEAIAQARAGQTGHFRASRTVDGDTRWWDVIVTPLTTDTPNATMVAVARDVTEQHRVVAQLRQSEERFRTLADALPQIVWSATAEGITDYFNEQWYAYVSPADAQEHTAVHWRSYIHPEDVGGALQQWMRSIEHGTPYHVEYRLKRHDGVYQWFMVRGEPLRDDRGVITRWFGSCTNIDEQKRADEDRARLLASERAARSEAERAARMKDDFVSTLSHELRTPLNAILGWTGVLRRDSSPDTLQKAIDIIDRNSRRQSQMIDDLLDISRIVSGKMRLEVERVDLAPVIEEALASATPAADAKGVRLITILGSAAVIEGDPGRLQQVVWNIVSNAIKFTPKGGKVQITLRKVNSHVHIEVADTGSGIRPDLLPYIFERFRQEDSSRTRRQGGLGLGLAIVKNLVEMHGGTVSATSPGEGGGSVFTVRLPLASAHRLPAELPTEPLFSPAELAGLLTGVHVLVLDDEPDARELVGRLLTDAGAEVSVAGSARDALALVNGGRVPTVILSDIGLPEQDGYHFIQSVRRMPGEVARVPAAALTALARVEDRKRALASGYQAHLAKPVDPTELVLLVASLAGRSGRLPA